MITFVSPKGLRAQVCKSQLLPLHDYVQSNNIACRFLNHESNDQLIDTEIKYNSLFIYFLSNNISGHVYVRSLFDFFAVFLSRIFSSQKLTIIYDFRGLVSEESYMRNGSSFKRNILRFMERFVYKNACIIHTVSNSFDHYLKNKYPAREVTIIPCCVGGPPVVRKSKAPEIFRFVYLGSLAHWQHFEETIIYFKKIQESINNVNLTVLTSEITKASEILIKHKITDFTVKTIEYEKVKLELSNYHFGFLFRDDSIVNKVASPIKFLEYIEAGVIPIVTRHVGDFSDIVYKERVGVIVDLESHVIESFNFDLWNENTLARMRKLCKEHTWNIFLNKKLGPNCNYLLK